MAARDTPVMRQHADAKREYPEAIVFFRLGDFYEMFGEDAIVAAGALDLVLTSRNKGQADEIPMCGVPHHAAHGYITRLLDLGHRVALCEQLADPAKCRGLVPRQVVKVITPGLVTEDEYLRPAANNWLAAAQIDASGVGLALLDLSTVELAVVELADVAALLAELVRAGPREVLVGGDQDVAADVLPAIGRVLVKALVRADSSLEISEQERALDLVGEIAISDWERRAAARVLRFAQRCNPNTPLPSVRLIRWEIAEHLVIDEIAQGHLELAIPAHGDPETTLLNVIDVTRTPAGGRLMRRSLLAPMRHVPSIRRQLDRVEFFVVHSRLRRQLATVLGEIGDLERLATRVELGQVSPRELGALGGGLRAAAEAVALLEAQPEPDARQVLGLPSSPVDVVSDVAAELRRALVERPPSMPKEGEVFRAEYDSELAELSAMRRAGTDHIVALETRLRAETGVASLKIRFTRVFGWYVEVTRSQTDRVPSNWRRKQTVASGERFTLDELDDLADRIAHAEERHRERELELLRELVALTARASSRIRTLAMLMANWDMASALAEVAHRHDYCRPEVDDGSSIEIVDGRHPVVERLAAAGRFVPNDCRLDCSRERLMVLTGPNMAGKSTYLRQVAEIVILAQMGSYVPAKSARIGVVDRVLSRVGASDNLARGESTFMVEMRETSQILRNATRKSLVILDEVGRGTSTFDGLAIAWAVAEHLETVVGCRALFATHYHELTALSDSSSHIVNFSVSARELDGDVVFFHHVEPGPASRSYGVAVAKLAGLPESVLRRARSLLIEFEKRPAQEFAEGGEEMARAQLDLFRRVEPTTEAIEQVRHELQNLDADRLTPLEALALIHGWKRQI